MIIVTHIIKKGEILPKTKKFGCVCRGDLTLLFFSKVVKQMKVRGDLSTNVEDNKSFKTVDRQTCKTMPYHYSCVLLRIINQFIRTSNRFSRYQINAVALFSTGLTVEFLKLFLSSTLVDKSPLTFITFEKKRRVRTPLHTQPNFLVFGKII